MEQLSQLNVGSHLVANSTYTFEAITSNGTTSYEWYGNDTKTHSDVNSTIDRTAEYYYYWLKLEKEYRESELMIVKPVNYILGISAVLLNLLILISLLWRTASLKLRLKLIVSLAMSDALVAFLSTINLDVCFYNFWKKVNLCDYVIELNQPIVARLCRILLGDTYTIAQYAGLITMFMIAIDLIKAVCTPLTYLQWSTGRHGYIIVLLVWAIPAIGVITVSVATKYAMLGHDNWRYELGYVSFESVEDFFFAVSGFGVVALIALYFVIFFKLRKQFRTSPSPHSRNLRKAACTTLLIVVTYIVSMMPFAWILIIQLTGPIVYRSIRISWHVFRFLYLLNTVFDPIIYAVRIPEVKNGIKHLFKTIGCFRSSASRNLSGQTQSDATTGV